MGVFCTRRIVRSIGVYRGDYRPSSKGNAPYNIRAQVRIHPKPSFSEGLTVRLINRVHSKALHSLTHSPEIIMDKATILKNIGAIGRASKKLTDQVQDTAVACAIHAVKHGDVTLADQLVDALGKGLRRASLRAWFERQGPFKVQKGKDTFAFVSEKAKDLRAMSDDELTEVLNTLKWEEAKAEEPTVSVIDIEESFDRFINRLMKQVKEADVEVKNAELLEALNKAASKWHAERVLSQDAE